MSFFNKKPSDFKLRITIQNANNLAVADENGLSDPYAVLHIDNKKYDKTTVEKKTLYPVWNLHVNIPLQADKPIQLIEIFVWDKDKLTQLKFRDVLKLSKDMIADDFLGKIAIPVGQLFDLIHPSGRALEYDSPKNKEITLALEKRNIGDNVSGEIQIKFGIINNENKDFVKFWNDYIH